MSGQNLASYIKGGTQKWMKSRALLAGIKKNLDTNSVRSKFLKLNIGGKNVDLCSESTFTAVIPLNELNLLASLLNGRWDQYLLKDKDGRIYLDMEPEWILPIFNYMRASNRFSKSNGPMPALPRASRLHEEGFQWVIRKFHLESIFVGVATLSTSETDLNSTFGDLFYREAIAGFLRDSLQFEGFSAPSATSSYLELLYKGSRDGFTARQFHSCCDNKGSTIIVIKDNRMNVFGGFTDVPWSSRGGHKASTKTGLFSLQKEDKRAIRQFNIKNPKSAVYHNKR